MKPPMMVEKLLANEAAIEKIKARHESLVKVLPEKVFTEQKHLDKDSERDYWHYGYLVALQDCLRLLGHEVRQ